MICLTAYWHFDTKTSIKLCHTFSCVLETQKVLFVDLNVISWCVKHFFSWFSRQNKELLLHELFRPQLCTEVLNIVTIDQDMRRSCLNKTFFCSFLPINLMNSVKGNGTVGLINVALKLWSKSCQILTSF